MNAPTETETLVTTRRVTNRGTPLFPDEPRTLSELFIRAATQHDRPDALSYKRNGSWQQIASKKLLERIRHLALGLYSLGLRKGDRLALLAANSPEWTLTDAACQFLGVLDVPIYPTLAAESVGYILEDSAARVLVIDNAEAYERVSEAVEQCASIERIVFFDALGVTVENAISFDEVEARGRELAKKDSSLLETLSDATASDDVATIIYTSGTTGEPKGVMLTHANIISNVFDAGEKYDFSKRDVSLSVLPLCHIFERTGMYLYIYHGMAVNYAESIDKVPENLQEVRPTIFIGVPRIFEKVYGRARLKAAQSSGYRERIFDWAIEVAKEFALKREHGESVGFGLAIRHSLAL